MADAVRQTIELIKAEVKKLENQASEQRKMANSLCAMIGQPPLYEVTDSITAESSGIVSGEFYGQPLAGVVRKILEKRKVANQGPATVAEIYDAMLMGDYAFETANANNAKRNLRISLTKNSATFHRLPSGKYGLREWYPAVRDKKANGAARKADEPMDDLDEEAEAFHDGFDDADAPNAEMAAQKTTK